MSLHDGAQVIEADDSAIAALTHEDLSWWRKAHVATEDQLINDPELMIYEGKPQCGYFKVPAHRDGPNVPLVICRRESGAFVALRGFKSTLELVAITDVWPRYAKQRHLISDAAYYAAYEADGWPDAAPSADGAVGFQHNAPPEDDSDEALKQRTEEEVRAAQAWLRERVKAGGIKSQEDCNRATDWRDRIDKLRLKADKRHKSEKEPSLREGQRVDEKFSYRKDAVAISASLKSAFERFLQEEDRKRQEEARKAIANTAKPIEQIAPVRPVEAVGTQKTKRLSTKVEPVIKDMDAVFQFVKTRPEVIDFMNLTVRRLRGLGIDVPGVVDEPVKKVR